MDGKLRGYKNKHKKPSSSEPGKTKGLIPTPSDKCIAKGARSYKRSDYGSWCKRMDEKNKK